jgi:hypothetical protein
MEGKLSDFNDSYYLMRYCKDDTIYVTKICNIHNHNCLNFLLTHEKILSRFPLTILRQNCVANNISRPDYLCKLFERVRQTFSGEITVILDILFDNKFYDMLKILANNYNINNKVKQEIITSFDMDIMTPIMIYRMVNSWNHL